MSSAKGIGDKTNHLVFVYFVQHYPTKSDDPEKDQHDTVRYAHGELIAQGGHLVGVLTDVFNNKGAYETMARQSGMKV